MPHLKIAVVDGRLKTEYRREAPNSTQTTDRLGGAAHNDYRPAGVSGPSRRVATQQAQSTPHITPRETEVLRFVAEGLTNKQTASEMKISVKTVEKHRQAMMDKLHIHYTAWA